MSTKTFLRRLSHRFSLSLKSNQGGVDGKLSPRAKDERTKSEEKANTDSCSPGATTTTQKPLETHSGGISVSQERIGRGKGGTGNTEGKGGNTLGF